MEGTGERQYTFYEFNTISNIVISLVFEKSKFAKF